MRIFKLQKLKCLFKKLVGTLRQQQFIFQRQLLMLHYRTIKTECIKIFIFIMIINTMNILF